MRVGGLQLMNFIFELANLVSFSGLLLVLDLFDHSLELQHAVLIFFL